jgi:hypothetical protein
LVLTSRVGEEFHLPASVIEWGILAHDRLHPAHARRRVSVFDVQFGVGGTLAGVTMRAKIIRALDSHLANSSQNRLGPQFPIPGCVATRTRNAPLIVSRNGEL